jgi:hypothetical protein
VGVEAIAWVILGVTALVAAVRASHSHRAMLVGRYALGLLFTVAGALVNLVYLVTGSSDYATFAELSYLSFVRDTWAAVVAPNQVFWIGLLIAFELTVGVLVVLGERATQVALVAMIGFHVALLSFGWGFFVWAIPMLVALTLLLRAERSGTATAPASEVTAEEPTRRLAHLG